MRVLIEPSDYVFHNIGDVAMLQSAVARVRKLWSRAEIRVFTNDPEALRRFCPCVIPVPASGREIWLDNNFLPSVFGRYTPGNLPAWLRTKNARIVTAFWRLKLRGHAHVEAIGALNEFLSSVIGTDIFIVAGMGGIADEFPDYASDLLETMRLARDHSKYMAMLGQGIGPLRSQKLLSKATQVLPKINLIALREELNSLPVLVGLGVLPQRVMTTGDDTIELVYNNRCKDLGENVGVNLRVSTYSGVGQREMDLIRDVLLRFIKISGAGIVALPVSSVAQEEDLKSIEEITGQKSASVGPITTPEELSGEIHRCRLVITGSYHAGVFAAANGIPTIGLAKSDYYVSKFTGLTALFGDGCEVVRLAEDEFPVALTRSIDRLWRNAETFRERLLDAARNQISMSHKADSRLKAEVDATQRATL